MESEFFILFMTTSQSDSINILSKSVPNIRKTLVGKFEVCFEVSIQSRLIFIWVLLVAQGTWFEFITSSPEAPDHNL